MKPGAYDGVTAQWFFTAGSVLFTLTAVLQYFGCPCDRSRVTLAIIICGALTCLVSAAMSIHLTLAARKLARLRRELERDRPS